MNQSDWVGIVGVGIILLAYFLQTIGLLNSHGKTFYLMNGVGAAIACYASWLIHYWPFMILEGTWTIVSIYGWIKPRT